MINLDRIQLRWSLYALAATCLLAFLSCELVVKKLIVSAEAERLGQLLDFDHRKSLDGLEFYSVLADGSLVERPGQSWSERESEQTLELISRVLAGHAYRDGWVYAVTPVDSDAASGWRLARANISKRLDVSFLAVGLGFAGVWMVFCVLIGTLQRRWLRVFAREGGEIRRAFGLEDGSELGAIDGQFAALSSDLEGYRSKAEKRFSEVSALASIAKNASEGIFICDSTGYIDWANEGFLKMIGASLEDIQASEPFAYMRTERNDPLYLARLGRAMELGEAVSLELGGVRPNGVEYWVSLELKPLDVTPEGDRRFFGIQVDITEQRRSSIELEEVSRRFALAMESANVGIWDWDVKKDDMVWDEHTFGLYGVSRTKFRPSYRSWMKCIDPDDANRVIRLIDGALAKGDNIDLVFCVRKADGCEAYVKSVGRAFLNENGEVTRYIGIASDVTAEHGAKKNLIEQKEEAETLAFRLAEAVRESKKAAAEAYQATQAKSAFLAMMSHEIRTPMNGVIGMASLLLETELDEHQREYLNTIRISGDTLLTLINDILDYSKIESGKLEIEMATFSIRECVEEAADLLASKAAEKRVNLICRIDPATPLEVVGDITRLRQILVNLVGNAIKFTEVGEVDVCVHAPADGKVHFSVRDTGIGIPEDRMNRLFEVFSQVDTSTTRKYGGSGLGLSISRQLATLMGGTMWVESSVGRGSVFHFDVAFDGLESAPPDPVFAEQAELKGKRILVAQPNSVLRSHLQSLVERWGMVARVVPSLEHVAGSERFDVVLADEDDALLKEPGRVDELNTIKNSLGLFVTLVGHGNARCRSSENSCLLKPCRIAYLLDSLLSLNRRAGVCSSSSVVRELIADEGFASRVPLRILVADDNSVNQKVARMMLSKFGYSPDLVANGVEAVEAVKQCDYDLVFMDCQMPEMDGFEATRMIRDIERDRSSSKRAYIFALTANVRGESLERSKESGMDGFLAKPIKLGDIKTALLEVESGIVSRN